MKLIIAGSRTFNFWEHLDMHETSAKISNLLTMHGFIYDKHPTEIVCGGGGTDKIKMNERLELGLLVSNQGIDQLGELYAYAQNIKITYFPGDWKKYGRAAGPIRNKQMAEYADALLLIWDGKSRGSANMKAQMEALGKPIYEVILKKSNA